MAIDTLPSPLTPPNVSTTFQPSISAVGRARLPMRDVLAWLSVGAGFAGVGLLLIGDPYWLALGLGGWALAAGLVVISRDSEPRAMPYMGASVGLCVIFLWFVIEVVIGLLAGYEFNMIG